MLLGDARGWEHPGLVEGGTGWDSVSFKGLFHPKKSRIVCSVLDDQGRQQGGVGRHGEKVPGAAWCRVFPSLSTRQREEFGA